MKLFTLAITAACVAGLVASTAARRQGLPWYNAPMVWGPAGNYTCVTQPFPLQIVCDQQKYEGINSADARTFLVAHEHGHVFQIVSRRQVFYSNPEADADCYAATIMATSDPRALKGAIFWLENVLGPRGGDLLHGTGSQVAQLARQCARNAGVIIP